MNTPDALLSLAPKYLWWKVAGEVSTHPDLLLAQIMNLGTWEDVATLEAAVPPERLRQVLADAEPGQFSEKSWHFWHLRLKLAELGTIPPLPLRKFE